MDSPSDITYSRAPPEDTGVRSCDGHANLMAGIARGWAQRIIQTFMRIHLLAVDRPECSLIQISDVAIGSNVFQIGERCAVRRCGSNFEDYHRRARDFNVRCQRSTSIDEEFALVAGAVRAENIEL